jgi:hypothetical protein
MKKLMVLLMLVGSTGLVLSQTKIWERNAASGNFPTFMGTANTERGFATGTLVLQPYTRIWEKSGALGTLPSYMGTGNTERGFASGKVGANERVLLVDRKAGNLIFVLNAATGDSVGRLDTTGLAALASGTFAINDVEISADGVIYVCNLTTNATTSAFKVYKWSSETATPQLALSYTGTALRYGDKFTVTGSTLDNSIAIWAASASGNKVVKFTTADNGATFTPTEITLSGTINSSSPAVIPNSAGTEIFVKSNGTYLKRYLINGTLVDSVSGSMIGTGSNALRYFEVNAKKYLAVYTYGSGNENVRTIDVTNGLANAVLIGASPTMGSTSNANGTGDVAMKMNSDKTVNLYVLSTNNGIGVYQLNPANYGTMDRMYVVSRKAGNMVFILNAATGDSVGRLDTTGLAGIGSGTFVINDAEVSSDGVIYACNLTTSSSTSAFKVYRWKNESATPQLVVNYTGVAFRFGDKFTVTGSTANSTVTIWAVGAGSNKVLKFTTADSGATFTPTEITLIPGLSSGAGSPAIYPNLTATEFYVKGNGDMMRRYLANGSVIDSLSGSVLGTGSNATRYFELAGKKFLAVYTYGSGNEFARIIDVSSGLLSALSLSTTPSLGSVSNGNGTGDVSFKLNGDGTVTLYVLGTNNGIGAYTYMPPTKVATPVFSPLAGTYNAPIYMKISVGTSNAKIYYTLNGATPDSTVASGSKLYTDSVKVSDTLVTVKAIAYAAGMQPSDVASATYKIVILNIPAADPVYTLWAKTQAAGTFPMSFSTGNYERGMSYGKVGGKDRIYVLARTGGPRIVIFDAMKGDSVGVVFPQASVTGGTFPLNFVEVSDDGVIFAGNMTLDVSTSSFKLYRWNKETDTATVVIDYTNPALSGCRLGDIISVFGKASDNTLAVFAAASGKDKIVKFTTTTQGATFTSQVITLSNGPMGSVPNVALAADGSLYVKSYGYQVYHYTAAGTLIDSVASAYVGTNVTDIKYVERLGKKYLLCYYPNDGAPYTNERFTMLDITTPSSPVPAFACASIGNKPNLNGTGAVDYLALPNNNFIVFILGTNNGVAAFANTPSVVISTLDTLFYGTSKNLLKNPFGPGYICGTNGYGDLGKYQRFDFKKGDNLAGFRFSFGYVKVVGTPDTLNLVVKTVSSKGAPDVTIAKLSTTMDKVDIVNGNTFLLDAPLTVNGPVFIGFEWSKTSNDTIAVYCDANGEGNKANRVWELYSDGTYGDFVSDPNLSWHLDTDLWIAAYYKKGVISAVESNVAVIPQIYTLDQNYPNPFNPTTTIRFSLPISGRVSLRVYNILGQQVAELMEQQLPAGTHSVSFNATGLSSGVYLYRLEAKGADGSQFNNVKKLLLLK